MQALCTTEAAGVALPDLFAQQMDQYLSSLEEKGGKLAYLAEGRAYGYTPTATNAHLAAAIRELLSVGTRGRRHRAHLDLVQREKPLWKIDFVEVEVPDLDLLARLGKNRGTRPLGSGGYT